VHLLPTNAPSVDAHGLGMRTCVVGAGLDHQRAAAFQAADGVRAATLDGRLALPATRTARLRLPAARTEVLEARARLLVRVLVGLAEHAVDAGVQIVDPPGERLTAAEGVGAVAGALHVAPEVRAALAARQHVLQRVEEALVLGPLRGRRAARVVERHRVQHEPHARSPDRRQEAVGAAEGVGAEAAHVGRPLACAVDAAPPPSAAPSTCNFCGCVRRACHISAAGLVLSCIVLCYKGQQKKL
jgi:hypothetical protein